MTFTQDKKYGEYGENGKNTNYPLTFFEKTQQKWSPGSKFGNKTRTAFFGTEHTTTTDKNKVIQGNLIFNPIPF